ncbi:hypothetical protein TcasGA2_TC032101 [Tribolium castaneum]|uniref:Uncharacterized protein n=1 Tax=Tribolium castaneum TaxID=7070 RepID=A0A139WMP4_TRICA|nr:hypothetical protein TcasGA2_TC032101 [Tribolium castaneum]
MTPLRLGAARRGDAGDANSRHKDAVDVNRKHNARYIHRLTTSLHFIIHPEHLKQIIALITGGTLRSVYGEKRLRKVAADPPLDFSTPTSSHDGNKETSRHVTLIMRREPIGSGSRVDTVMATGKAPPRRQRRRAKKRVWKQRRERVHVRLAYGKHNRGHNLTFGASLHQCKNRNISLEISNSPKPCLLIVRVLHAYAAWSLKLKARCYLKARAHPWEQCMHGIPCGMRVGTSGRRARPALASRRSRV